MRWKKRTQVFNWGTNSSGFRGAMLQCQWKIANKSLCFKLNPELNKLDFTQYPHLHVSNGL